MVDRMKARWIHRSTKGARHLRSTVGLLAGFTALALVAMALLAAAAASSSLS
ncbi:MAG TPA: hypothetical protein VFO28_15270 [Burkholderiaceae bacterium]|nr:hypothetical protein [Burkholderiaceae bacterium]